MQNRFPCSLMSLIFHSHVGFVNGKVTPIVFSPASPFGTRFRNSVQESAVTGYSCRLQLPVKAIGFPEESSQGKSLFGKREGQTQQNWVGDLTKHDSQGPLPANPPWQRGRSLGHGP